jgi:hypothetical protein
MVILGIKQAVVEKMKIWGGDYASWQKNNLVGAPLAAPCF